MATTPTGAHEWSRMWHHHGLNIRLLQASHVQHVYLLERYADLQGNRQRIGREQKAIQRARHLIDKCFAEVAHLRCYN